MRGSPPPKSRLSWERASLQIAADKTMPGASEALILAELDANPGWLIDDRLSVIATLVFAELGDHELAALRWGDLDFATSIILVRRWKTRPGSGRSRSFRRRTKDNVRLRILLPVLTRRGAAEGARSGVVAAGDHPALAPDPVASRALRDRRRLCLGDPPTGPHQPCLYPARLRPHRWAAPTSASGYAELADGYEVVREATREFNDIVLIRP
jgi:hypothetical protein